MIDTWRRKTKGIIRRGTRAAQPDAIDVLEGTIYFVTNEFVIERSNGVAWESFSPGNEEFQDNIGAILVDSATIDFTYNDATPSIVADVKNDSITYAKIQNISATDKLLGRSTTGAGDIEEIPLTAVGRALLDDAAVSDQRTTLGLGALATLATIGTAQIDNDAVTYAKMQNVSATDKMLGRVTAGAGDVEEITVTAAGRALLDDAAASNQRTTLGLGTADSPSFTGLTATAALTGKKIILTGQNIGTLVTGNNNDYALPDAATIAFSFVAAGSVLTGLGAGVQGQLMILFNNSATTFTINQEDANSAAINRFSLGSFGATLSMSSTEQFFFIYSSTRWRVIR